MACRGKGGAVKHFSEEDWLDFVREVMPSSRRAAMEEHLESKCPECVQVCQFWEHVRDIAQREPANEVPSTVLRAADAVFADWRLRFVLPARAKRAFPIFDSLLDPLPLGVRSAAQAPRRVLHRSGRWTVDLRIESEPGDRVSITGQVLKPGWQPKEEFKTRVLLASHHTSVAETDTNHFGEFQFAFHRAPHLTIYITVSGQHVIAIPLPEPDQPLQLKKRSSNIEKSGNDPA